MGACVGASVITGASVTAGGSLDASVTSGSSVGGGATEVSAAGGVESSASTLVGRITDESNEKRMTMVTAVSFLVRIIVKSPSQPRSKLQATILF
jgi:hypothetical protein